MIYNDRGVEVEAAKSELRDWDTPSPLVVPMLWGLAPIVALLFTGLFRQEWKLLFVLAVALLIVWFLAFVVIQEVHQYRRQLAMLKAVGEDALLTESTPIGWISLSGHHLSLSSIYTGFQQISFTEMGSVIAGTGCKIISGQEESTLLLLPRILLNEFPNRAWLIVENRVDPGKSLFFFFRNARQRDRWKAILSDPAKIQPKDYRQPTAWQILGQSTFILPFLEGLLAIGFLAYILNALQHQKMPIYWPFLNFVWVIESHVVLSRLNQLIKTVWLFQATANGASFEDAQKGLPVATSESVIAPAFRRLDRIPVDAIRHCRLETPKETVWSKPLEDMFRNANPEYRYIVFNIDGSTKSEKKFAVKYPDAQKCFDNLKQRLPLSALQP